MQPGACPQADFGFTSWTPVQPTWLDPARPPSFVAHCRTHGSRAKRVFSHRSVAIFSCDRVDARCSLNSHFSGFTHFQFLRWSAWKMFICSSGHLQHRGACIVLTGTRLAHRNFRGNILTPTSIAVQSPTKSLGSRRPRPRVDNGNKSRRFGGSRGGSNARNGKGIASGATSFPLFETYWLSAELVRFK